MCFVKNFLKDMIKLAEKMGGKKLKLFKNYKNKMLCLQVLVTHTLFHPTISALSHTLRSHE